MNLLSRFTRSTPRPVGGWCALVRVPDRQKPQYYPVSAGDLFLLAVLGSAREGEQIVGKRRRFVGNEEIAFAHEQKRNAHEQIAFPDEQKRNAHEEKQFPDYRRRLSTTSARGRAKPCTRWFHLAVFTISYKKEGRKRIL